MTLTSFSSLEISELEVKGLILSLFQVILVADGNNYLSQFFGTISQGNLKEITSTAPLIIHQPPVNNSLSFLWAVGGGAVEGVLTSYLLSLVSPSSSIK